MAGNKQKKTYSKKYLVLRSNERMAGKKINVKTALKSKIILRLQELQALESRCAVDVLWGGSSRLKVQSRRTLFPQT